jgi:hypothetical protein
MPSKLHRVLGWLWPMAGAATTVLLLAGCVGVRTSGEKTAQGNQQIIERPYRPRGAPPTLPDLSSNSPLGDFLRYAMLNQPQVEAAYYDWAASVRRITVERSLPEKFVGSLSRHQDAEEQSDAKCQADALIRMVTGDFVSGLCALDRFVFQALAGALGRIQRL